MCTSDTSQSSNNCFPQDLSYNIGILALQGNFVQHRDVLLTLNSQFPNLQIHFIKTLFDISSRTYDAIIIPGGESTTMSCILDKQNMRTKLKALIQNKLPILGTCAGLIFLSNRIENQDDTQHPRPLGVAHVAVARNGYGKQLDSFVAEIDFLPHHQHSSSNIRPIKGMFIRAPKIIDVGIQATILARYQGAPVIVQEDNILMTTFHPEAVGEIALHRYFIEYIMMPSNNRM